MKKFAACFIVCVMMVISLCACGGGGNTSCKPNLNCTFSVNAEIQYDDMTAAAVITRIDKGNWDVEFSEPDTLSGVVLSFRDNNVEASYKGLSFSVPKSALPLKSMLLSFIDAADNLAEKDEITGDKKDEEIVVNGESEMGKYVIKFNDKNLLSGFEMENLNLVMIFKDFTVKECETETTETTGTEATEAAETTETAESTELTKTDESSDELQ